MQAEADEIKAKAKAEEIQNSILRVDPLVPAVPAVPAVPCIMVFLYLKA
jgi:hypothetical protein